jgi:peptidoglycan/LPS O-acetylase OafA/YrhL
MILQFMRRKFLSEAPGGQQDSPGHLPSLDVLRGLAATWVVLFHLVYLTTPNLAPPTLIDKLVKSGGMGVTLFFIVSAFSLCLSGERHSGEGAWPFYLRRLFRIVPLFYVILLVSLLRDQVAFGVQHSYVEIAASLLFVFNFVAGWQEGIVWASWTIGIEMAFYLLFPMIWQRGNGTFHTLARALWLACGSIVAYSCITYFADGPQFWQWSFFKHLPSFLLGMLVFELFAALRTNSALGLAVGRVALAAGLLLGVALFYSEQQFPLMAPLYWQGLLCALVVLGSTLGAASRFFSLPPLRWLGRNSYSIYLTHPLVIVALQPAIKKIAAGNHSAPPGVPAQLRPDAGVHLRCVGTVLALGREAWYAPGFAHDPHAEASLQIARQQR